MDLADVDVDAPPAVLGEDVPAVLGGDAPAMPAAMPAVLGEDAPAMPAVLGEDAPALPAVLGEDAPATPAVLGGGAPAVPAEDAPDDADDAIFVGGDDDPDGYFSDFAAALKQYASRPLAGIAGGGAADVMEFVAQKQVAGGGSAAGDFEFSDESDGEGLDDTDSDAGEGIVGGDGQRRGSLDTEDADAPPFVRWRVAPAGADSTDTEPTSAAPAESAAGSAPALADITMLMVQ